MTKTNENVYFIILVCQQCADIHIAHIQACKGNRKAMDCKTASSSFHGNIRFVLMNINVTRHFSCKGGKVRSQLTLAKAGCNISAFSYFTSYSDCLRLNVIVDYNDNII